MGKNGWQAVAFFAIAVAAAMSALAWSLSQALETANAQLRERPEPRTVTIVEPSPVPARTSLSNDPSTDLPPGSRCINGDLFREIDGALTNVGRC